MVNPAEWLRAVSRRGLDEDALAVEAAGALAEWSRTPAGLVVACRRLLAHHPEHTPLWWLAARVLGSPDPRLEAHESAGRLDVDPTADHLARALPILEPHEVVAVVGWTSAVDRALAARADVGVVAVRTPGVDPTGALRRRVAPQPVPVVDVVTAATRPVRAVLVPVLALGPDAAHVPAGTGAALDALVGTDAGAGAEGQGASGVAVWLVVATGRILPAALFEARRRAIAESGGSGPGATGETADEDALDRVVGPRGTLPLGDVRARPDCPVVPELLRPLDLT